MLSLVAVLVILVLLAIILYICAYLDKSFHWLLKRRGVTELTHKQRRRLAKHYKETTGRKQKR